MPRVRDDRATGRFRCAGHRRHRRGRRHLRQSELDHGHWPAALGIGAPSRLRLLHAPDAATGRPVQERTGIRVARARPA